MKIQLIIGSTRPGRIGPQVADWLLNQIPKTEGLSYEVVDILTWELPLFDEPMLPMMHQYKHDYTKAWSEKISEADGYIFLTSEYNAGYPASLKNAIDYLSQEWTDKPVMIASYGYSGGASASAQLKQVAERLKMVPTEISPAMSFTQDMFGEDYRLKDLDTNFADYVKSIQEAAKQLATLVDEAQK
jgi:NAD(P)H-dependent FMN reductase